MVLGRMEGWVVPITLYESSEVLVVESLSLLLGFDVVLLLLLFVLFVLLLLLLIKLLVFLGYLFVVDESFLRDTERR